MPVQAQHQFPDFGTSSRMEGLQSGLTSNPSASKKRRLDEVGTRQQYTPHLVNRSRTSAGQELLSQFCQQGVEIDTLLRLQVERMRSEVEAVRKRQCRDLISVLRQQALKMMRDKDAEIERASRRNMELERKVRELAAQSQLWFTAAKNSEALACNLKSTLEQALQNVASTALCNECDAEDAASCCSHGVDGREELH